MSITCSIPGCNGRTSLTNETKLYRVPAVAIGSSESSGLIYNLTNDRRKKWFEVLENCGLNEDNAASFRVCSYHFKDGKPSPVFDNTSKDWVPSINLPFSENVIEEEEIEVDNIKEKRKRGRPFKRETKIRDLNERVSPIRSKSVGRSKSIGYTKSFGRSKSVCRSKFIENESTEESNSDQPFVFVDIQKIKEGTPIAFREPTPRPQSPKQRIVEHKIKTKSMPSRSFGTQTNPNVLPPLKWGRHRSKKQQDPRYRTIGIQTEAVSKFELAVSDNTSFQACLGEIIEFVRMQILDYNLKALGNSFKIKECALQFQKEGDVLLNHKDKEANTVVVHPTRLLSSNWPLLEAVAMSLDLYRLQQKNDKSTSTGFLRTLTGKTETIEKISDILAANAQWGNPIKELDKTIENPLAEIAINDDENGNHSRIESTLHTTNKNTVISPVLPRITSVISIGELLKDSSSSKSSAKQNAARKKLATVSVPPPHSVPHVSRLTPRNSSAGRKRGGRIKKIPYITNKKRIPIEGNLAVQNILGTDKVPRVVLSKLPESVFRNGGRVPLGVLSTVFTDAKAQRTPSPGKGKHFDTSPQLVWVPGLPGDGTAPTKVSLTHEVNATPLSFKAVKNIPLKMPQAPGGVAGYLLVPNAGTVGGTAPIMYVPKPDGADVDATSDGIEPLIKTGLPVQTLMLSGSTIAKPADDANQLAGGSAQSSSLLDVSPISRALHVTEPKITKLTDQPRITKVAIPKLARKRGPSKKPKMPRRRKKSLDSKDEEGNVCQLPDENHMSISHRVELSTARKESSNDGEALLRCPYCLKDCKDGLDFINHHKTTGCKGKKNAVTRTKCKQYNEFYRTDDLHQYKKGTGGGNNFHDCNVCGKVFVKAAHLNVHLITHVEYEVWNEKCTDCPKKFATSEELEDHVASRHSWKVKIANFECERCEKRFTTRKRLECHVQKKHPVNVKKKCNIRIRCKFCRDIFELEHYRQVHWEECKEKKTQEEKMENETNENILGEKVKANDKIKITKANRESIKVKVTKRNTEDERVMTNIVKIENAEFPEEIPRRKPTALRSKIIKKEDFNDDLEAQLSRMFQEDSSADSSPSEYEHEELLNEDFEGVITTKQIKSERQEKAKKGMKRLMNIDEMAADEDFELPPTKISRIDDGEIEDRNDDEILNENSNMESMSTESNTKKIEINSLLSIDGSTNDIVIEEMEDDEYFSMDESTQ